MAKYGGGFGGGMGNMQALLKQAQQMQQKMQEAQEELAETEVTGDAGGGLVEVTMTCKKEVVAVSIKPEAVDLDDLEMLEDLIIVAIKDASAKADEMSAQKMGPMGGLGGLM